MIHNLHSVQNASIWKIWILRGLMLVSTFPLFVHVSQFCAQITLGMVLSILVIFIPSLQSTILTRSVGTFAYHLAQLILFGKLAAQCGEVGDKVTAGLQDGCTGGDAAVSPNAELESSVNGSHQHS